MAPGEGFEAKVQSLYMKLRIVPLGIIRQLMSDLRVTSYRQDDLQYSRVTILALKLRDVRTEIIREDNGTYAVACSTLGVYSVGKTLREAKRNFQQALDLHLSVVREKARKELAIVSVSA